MFYNAKGHVLKSRCE